MPAVTPLPSTALLPHSPDASRRLRSLVVAVIGAGAAGLVAARELRREGHAVVVFERSSVIGGTWVYSPLTEWDPLSLDPSRTRVHSSLYPSLRTNLPRECMGFLDFPFLPSSDGEGDPRRFPGHLEVLRYLQRFAHEFDLYKLVRFRTDVVRISRIRDGKWSVGWREEGGVGEDEQQQVFDGVLVCNGHYTHPRLADIPGMDKWTGLQLHSHNYRHPEPYRNKVVIIIGNSSSAHDISREIASFAKEVHVAIRPAPAGAPTKDKAYDNMWLHSMIECAKDDGTVVFQDGSSVLPDVIMHCTGYQYYFPFLRDDSTVTVDDNRVQPLYKHIFPPQVGPELSFIGLPWKVIPFPLCELQSKWVAGILSGRIQLVSAEEMDSDIASSDAQLEAKGWPKRYTHCLSGSQFEYNNWLAEECGYPLVEEWRKHMYEANGKNRATRPEKYRDEWDDEHLVAEAYIHFQKLL